MLILWIVSRTSGNSRRAGLDDQQELPVVADPTLPAVDRMDVGNEVDAGRLPVADQGVGDVEGLFFGADGRDDDDEILTTHGRDIPRLGGGEVKGRGVSISNPRARAQGRSLDPRSGVS